MKCEAQGSIVSNASIMTHSNYFLVLVSIEVFISFCAKFCLFCGNGLF